MSLTKNKNEPEPLPPAETTTDDYRPPFTIASLFVPLSAIFQAINAVRWYDYAVAVLTISLFVLYFVVRFILLKFLTVRKLFRLRNKVVFLLDMWLIVTYCSFMSMSIFATQDVVFPCAVIVIWLCCWAVWIRSSLFLVTDLVACWKIWSDEQKQLAAENV